MLFQAATSPLASRRESGLSSPSESIRGARNDAAVPLRSYSALSLYAGAGGLDLGFITAGFEIAWAIDSDEQAVATYRENLGDHIVCGELPDTTPPADLTPDIVIGGPPCQGFSVIGRMDPSDERSRHVFGLLDVVARYQPRAFVLENVKALAVSPRWSTTRNALRTRAEQLGYQVEILVLNAADYGVPQGRERMFMIGMRETRPVRPTPSTKGRPVTVRKALASLPRYGEPGNDGVCAAKVVPATKPVMRPSAHKGSLLFNGSGRPLDLDATAKTIPASMGGNATPIIDQDELEHGAAPWVVNYHARLVSGKRPLKKAPARMRRITVQEAAVLQSFPTWFRFTGPQVAQFRQIGNAVPPILAEHVASAVRDTLRAVDAQTSSEVISDGALALV
jgi:DNA (cytosine-5)-methyltransferase 1